MKIIRGDLISLALEGKFNAICQGCNCMNVMGAGVAKQIKAQWPDVYKIDQEYGNSFHDRYNMMGTYSQTIQSIGEDRWLTIYNLYTQFHPGSPSPQSDIPFDYDAFAVVCKKLNQRLKGFALGMPWVGCGLAGADKSDVASIIKYRMPDVYITIVDYENNQVSERQMVSTGLGDATNRGEDRDRGTEDGGGESPLDGVSRRDDYGWPEAQ